jgi:hypothetical protein
MLRHIGRYVAVFAIALMATAANSVFADNECQPQKSLFVNIASARPHAVQVALLVAYVNIGVQKAEVQLFFADAAAPYVIDTEKLTKKQLLKLNIYLRKEFGYSISDILRLQGGGFASSEGLPTIKMLQELSFGAQVYGCSLCVSEALTAAGVDPTLSLEDYLIAGASIISPDDFSAIYDQYDTEGSCPKVSASVISF